MRSFIWHCWYYVEKSVYTGSAFFLRQDLQRGVIYSGEKKIAFLIDRTTDSYARLTVLVDAKTISKPPVIVTLHVHEIKAMGAGTGEQGGQAPTLEKSGPENFSRGLKTSWQ